MLSRPFAAFIFIVILLGYAEYTAAQPSHLHNLIETYKAQNPGVAPRTAGNSNPQRGQTPPNRTVYPPPMPVNPQLLSDTGLIKDPYAKPDDIISQPIEQNDTVLTALKQPLVSSTTPSLLAGGNPKDPLNPRFIPDGKFDSVQDNSQNPYSEWQLDARLNDVFFIDTNCGWAVGDHGTIWNTQDGGQMWLLQETPIDCTLHSIRFCDASFGIAVGGYYYPSIDQSRGVILVTQNGGKNWLLVPVPDMPSLQTVHIINPMKIQVTGEPSDRYPGGTFLSNDAGRTWKPESSLLEIPQIGKGLTSFPPLIERICSEQNGKTVFFAGSPGTMIYSSNDSGKTWKAVPTGITADIRRIVFADGKTGWAIGGLGTILKTEDGGTSWKLQRAGGKKLAVLGLFGIPDDIPLEAFVSLCAHQGYLGGVSLLFHSNEPKTVFSVSPERVRESVIRTGVSVAGSIAIPLERREMLTTMDALVKKIQQANDNKGMEQLRERLVAVIRTWQPEIVLTATAEEPNLQTASRNPSAIVRELALREIIDAVKKADDPAAFPLQITELGLKPWKVKKIHVALPNGTLGDVNLNTKEPSIRLGQPLDETAFVSYGILGIPRNHQPIIGFSTPYNLAPPAQNRDFFAGIEILPGSESRRGLAGSYAEQWDAIQLRIQQRQQTLGIIENIANTAKKNKQKPSDVYLASSAEELTRKIDKDAAVQVLLEMGQNYQDRGEWDSVCEAYEVIAKHYAQHPLARPAFFWLLQYYASGENPKNKPTASVSASLDAAIALERYLAQYFPDLADKTEVRFTLASALRQRGFGQDAANLYQEFANRPLNNFWTVRAKAEYHLTAEDKSSLPPGLVENPLPAILCTATQEKPYLDGKFDKEFDKNTWFSSKLYSLTPEKTKPGVKTASRNFGTKIMTMYDSNYFYIGLRCKRVAGFSYPPLVSKPRSRDIPLDNQDRVEILLDIDRDYQTYYSFTIDSRGWAVDSYRGDTAWNPSWYVARHEDKDSYYIEAAIPWESLTNRSPKPGDAWAVGIRRIVPGVGIECWNAENSNNLTEGFGFLVFE